MSLKAFHLVFITASVLLVLGLAGWQFSLYRENQQAAHLTYAALGLVAGLGLLAYGRYFLNKLRHISYL